MVNTVNSEEDDDENVEDNSVSLFFYYYFGLLQFAYIHILVFDKGSNSEHSGIRRDNNRETTFSSFRNERTGSHIKVSGS